MQAFNSSVFRECSDWCTVVTLQERVARVLLLGFGVEPLWRKHLSSIEAEGLGILTCWFLGSDAGATGGGSGCYAMRRGKGINKVSCGSLFHHKRSCCLETVGWPSSFPCAVPGRPAPLWAAARKCQCLFVRSPFLHLPHFLPG